MNKHIHLGIGEDLEHNNSLHILHLYRPKGTINWMFTDDRFGLRDEPFVAGMPEIIDHALGNNNETEAMFVFSDEWFPTMGDSWAKTDELTLLYEEGNGTWYESKNAQRKGWLCSALYFYFPDSAPKKLYANAHKE